MARETSGKWLGPCGLDVFLTHFLGLDEPLSLPPFNPQFFAGKEVNNERDMYKHFGAFINGNGVHDRLVQGYVWVDSSNHPDPNSRLKIRPDSGFVEEASFDPAHPNNMGTTLLIGEDKLKHGDIVNDDPTACTDPDHTAPYEATAQSKVEIRGQLATYATEVCRRQHRTHFFMLYVFHPCIRFLRWDRSGIVVSKSFDYTEDCTPLVHFLCRFAKQDLPGKGFDPTVTLANAKETAHAKVALSEWKPQDVERPVFKMQVPDGERMRDFLVWGPLAEPHSPLGRATRGYPTIEVTKEGFSPAPMFLKEQWRSSSVKQEADTLRRLRDAGVQYVPTFVCGGDLLDQVTKSSDYPDIDRRIGERHVEVRIHTRFVVKEVGLPLSRFPSSKVMFAAIHDAYKGHKQAYDNCGILHRDVSGGNILILKDGSGMLSDWDLAKDQAELLAGARTEDRTGTWYFMSVALLRNSSKLHSVRDDMESFVWVVLYHGLRYLPHSHVSQLGYIMDSLFEQHDVADNQGTVNGGSGKNLLITRGSFIGHESKNQFTFDRCPALTWFVEAIVDLLDGWGIDERATRRTLKTAPLQSPGQHSEAESDAEKLAQGDPLLLRHVAMDSIWETTRNDLEWPMDADPASDQTVRYKKMQPHVPAQKRTASQLPEPLEDASEVRAEKKLRSNK